MKKHLAALLAFSFACLTHAQIEKLEGELDGAPYAVAVPDGWSGGKAFFHVHGWRPANALHTADLDLADPLYENLLSEGWLIGRTAFLENGVDHDAHTLALRDLKTWIENEIGPIDLLIMEGESTAGTLVLRIAEQDSDLAEGVIALGPFVNLVDPTDDMFLTAQPKLPAILMTNTTEILDDLEYAARTADSQTPAALRPLLRPGHINVNWVERLHAIRDLEQALTTDTALTFSNGTRTVPERETGTLKADGTLTNTVVSTNPFYGNALLGFHPAEFAAAGIQQGESFEITAHDSSWEVHYGKSYGDVPEGEWVAFPTADDHILLVRNHESAIATANLKVDDEISIEIP